VSDRQVQKREHKTKLKAYIVTKRRSAGFKEKNRNKTQQEEMKRTEFGLSQECRQALGARRHPAVRLVFNLGDQNRA